MSDIKKDQKQIEKEQTENGKIMDTMQKREHFLRKHKKVMNDNDAFMLYRLPLNEEQMKAVYGNIMKDEKD